MLRYFMAITIAEEHFVNALTLSNNRNSTGGINEIVRA